jgi:hypothetical protein
MDTGATGIAGPGGAPVSAGNVRIISWPTDVDALAELVQARTPRLVIVEEGSEPPLGSDCCQDWMWRTGDEREMRLRLRQVELRALAHDHDRPYIDSIGVLHVGLRSIPLSPKERALAAVLLERFNQSVSRDDLVRAAWPNGLSSDNVFAARLRALRSRIAWIGLEVRGSRRRGYSMRAAPLILGRSDLTGFEDEMGAARRLEGGGY